MSVPQIYVFPEDGAWQAEMIGTGAEHAFPELERTVCGGVVIPTAFTTGMTPNGVVTELEALNPGVVVDWFASRADWAAGAVEVTR